MQSSRIAELLDPFLGEPDARRLTPDALQHISTYINLLQRWNARVNLTAIRSEEEIVTRHFGESLFAARHLFPGNKNDAGVPHFSPPLREVGTSIVGSDITTRRTKVADIGSGAGFPGIPIKLWAPEISLTLIESNHKKATFLREVTRALTLTNVNIQTTRAESLADIKFDVVTLRAVERFESILPTAASLVAQGGRLALLIGQTQLSQAHSSLPALNWSRPISIPHSQSRELTIATNPQEGNQVSKSGRY
jgi:16S rRNA (guanine527-N7)-methyltransferase